MLVMLVTKTGTLNKHDTRGATDKTEPKRHTVTATLPPYLSFYLSIYLSICLSTSLSICLLVSMRFTTAKLHSILEMRTARKRHAFFPNWMKALRVAIPMCFTTVKLHCILKTRTARRRHAFFQIG